VFSALLISAQNPKRAFYLSPESDSGIAKNKPIAQRKQEFSLQNVEENSLYFCTGDKALLKPSV
jgi:hypothetical protein